MKTNALSVNEVKCSCVCVVTINLWQKVDHRSPRDGESRRLEEELCAYLCREESVCRACVKCDNDSAEVCLVLYIQSHLVVCEESG